MQDMLKRTCEKPVVDDVLWAIPATCAIMVIAIGVKLYKDDRTVVLLRVERAPEGFDAEEEWRNGDLTDDGAWDQKALRDLAPGVYRVHAHFWSNQMTTMDGTDYEWGVRVQEVEPVALLT